jgi:hypothetical protein
MNLKEYMMNPIRTVFGELAQDKTFYALRDGMAEKVEAMNAVAEDLIERGGTPDIDEFAFAIHGITALSGN